MDEGNEGKPPQLVEYPRAEVVDESEVLRILRRRQLGLLIIAAASVLMVLGGGVMVGQEPSKGFDAATFGIRIGPTLFLVSFVIFGFGMTRFLKS